MKGAACSSIRSPAVSAVNRQGRATRGFTLLEVLVALAALSLVLAVLLEQSRLATVSVRAAERQSQALAIAETQLAEVATFERLRDADDEGSVDPGWRWQRRIRAAASFGDRVAAAPSQRLWQVEVEVFDAAGSALRLSTLRLGGERQ